MGSGRRTPSAPLRQRNGAREGAVAVAVAYSRGAPGVPTALGAAATALIPPPNAHTTAAMSSARRNPDLPIDPETGEPIEAESPNDVSTGQGLIIIMGGWHQPYKAGWGEGDGAQARGASHSTTAQQQHLRLHLTSSGTRILLLCGLRRCAAPEHRVCSLLTSSCASPPPPSHTNIHIAPLRTTQRTTVRVRGRRGRLPAL